MDYSKLSGKGYRSYAAGALLILWGVGGAYIGAHDPGTAITYVASGLGVIGIRGKLEDITIPQEVIDKLKQNG